MGMMQHRGNQYPETWKASAASVRSQTFIQLPTCPVSSATKLTEHEQQNPHIIRVSCDLYLPQVHSHDAPGNCAKLACGSVANALHLDVRHVG